MEEKSPPAKRARRTPASEPKPAAPKKAAKPRAAARPRKGESAVTHIDQGERLQLIQTAAYLRAERRGFAGGSDLQDWLEAELEVDAMLGAVHAPRKVSRAKKAAGN
jgi:hypothetical protein